MIHRKQKHKNKVADCKNYQEGKCLFTEEKCYWNHSHEDKEISDQVKCFIRGENFKSKNEMMIHRKNRHERMVGICRKFDVNNCRLQKQFCWFVHKDEEMEIDSSKNVDRNENLENDSDFASVFRIVSGNKKPPISEEIMKKKIE